MGFGQSLRLLLLAPRPLASFYCNFPLDRLRLSTTSAMAAALTSSPPSVDGSDLPGVFTAAPARPSAAAPSASTSPTLEGPLRPPVGALAATKSSGAPLFSYASAESPRFLLGGRPSHALVLPLSANPPVKPSAHVPPQSPSVGGRPDTTDLP